MSEAPPERAVRPGRITSGCVFCQIVEGESFADCVVDFPGTIFFRPLNPVVPGHRLAVPKIHIADATDRPDIAGLTFEDAAWWAGHIYAEFNLITSKGTSATQTISHLHIHIIPRYEGDGLTLPWTGQHESLNGDDDA